MSIAIILHVLAVVVWVGGMFFAYVVLRPVAANQLESPQRLRLWAGVLGRFFLWVWVAIGVLLLTGFGMVFGYLGGFAGVGWHVHLMLTGGIAMIMIFLHVFFAPYRRLKNAVKIDDWQTGAEKLGQIRRLVGINTLLGLIITGIGSGGRFWMG